MRKVVINTCYGGFSLSILARLKLYKLKHPNETIYFYIEKPISNNAGVIFKIEETSQLTYYNSSDCLYISEKDFGDSFQYSLDKVPKELKELSFGVLERHDKDLVFIVETLKEKSFGDYARLEIKNIADNDRYVIHDYDGCEDLELESLFHLKDWK